MPLSTVRADQITQRVLSNAPSQFIGSLLAATPLQEVLPGTEIAKYLRVQRAQDAAYDRTSVKTTGWTGDVAGTDITVPVNNKRFGHYVIEDFDAFETPKADALVSATSASLSQNLYGTLDAEYLKAVNATTPVSTAFTLSTAATDADAEPFLNTLVDAVSDMEGLVNSERMTLPKQELFVLLSHKGYWRAAKWFKVYTQGTVDSISNGTIYGEKIGGINFIKHPFLGHNYTKGLTAAVAGSAAAGAAGINMDQDYDFSKLEAAVLSNEAVALPWTIISVKSGQEPYTLNDGVVMKYKFGVGIVRSDLIKTFHNAA